MFYINTISPMPCICVLYSISTGNTSVNCNTRLKCHYCVEYLESATATSNPTCSCFEARSEGVTIFFDPSRVLLSRFLFVAGLQPC